MLFNSYIFILAFLPLALLGYFMLNHYGYYKAALCELVIMSILFYAYNNVKYVWILIISILINWILASLLHRMENKRPNHCRWLKKVVLAIGILLNAGSIFYFKYMNFFIENFNKLISLDFELKNVVLPLGISFFTFQQISFLVDSYRGETKDYNFLEYAAFVSFLTKLVAGPIVLHNELISQFKNEKNRHFNHDNFSEGIYIFALGLFKNPKVVKYLLKTS